MNAAKSHRKLPPLASLTLLSETMKPGLCVEECDCRLQRAHYAFKRLREVGAPDMMASIITGTPVKSWVYSQDETRQHWDEARLAMMAEVGFANLETD